MNGLIRISKMTCSARDDFIEIEIQDEKHGRLLKVAIEAKEFTYTLTGLVQECEISGPALKEVG